MLDDGGRNSNTKFSVLFAHLGVMCVQNLKRCQLLQNLQIWLSFYAWSSSLQFVHATLFFLLEGQGENYSDKFLGVVQKLSWKEDVAG